MNERYSYLLGDCLQQGSETAVHRPNSDCHLFLKNKFCWDIAMVIHSAMVACTLKGKVD